LPFFNQPRRRPWGSSRIVTTRPPPPRYHPDNRLTAGGDRDVLDNNLLLRRLASQLRQGLKLLGEQPQESCGAEHVRIGAEKGLLFRGGTEPRRPCAHAASCSAIAAALCFHWWADAPWTNAAGDARLFEFVTEAELIGLAECPLPLELWDVVPVEPSVDHGFAA
jgi:hypothetical protein